MTLQPTSLAASRTLFAQTAADLLPMLREHIGLRLWITAQIKGDRWLVSAAHGDAYGIRAGHAFSWSDTLCSRMATAAAPQFAAHVQEIAAYASAPFAAEFRIGAYIGVPLTATDGRVLGSVCAFDPAPHAPIGSADQNMVHACARVLSRAMQADARTAKQSRRLERTEAVAFCDGLTGLYNRRGWDHLVKAEESRCRRHGRTACVVSVDLDDLKLVNDYDGHAAGDDLIRRAAEVLRATTRTQDIVARVGGDEFALVAVDFDAAAVVIFRDRLDSALAKEAIRASIGVALRDPAGDLFHTWREADQAMFESKRARKGASRKPAVSVAEAAP